MAQVSFQDAGGRLYGEMQKCIIYIRNHPDQDITMEDLADWYRNGWIAIWKHSKVR